MNGEFRIGARGLLRLCLILCVPESAGSGPAQIVHVVRNDLGGRIDRRAEMVESLRARGDRVEIRGRFCLSACTLFLGARDVCVDRDTVFGFHGPTLWGLPLDQPSFEYWSEVIANHYTPALRDWYLEVARHRLHGYHRLSGRQMIELGYTACR